MTILEIEADTSDTIYGSSSVDYATARSTATDISSASMTVGQVSISPAYTQFNVYRGFLRFDTSVIPADATITEVALRLVPASNPCQSYNVDIQIVELDWSASDPITSGNKETPYDACLAASDFFVWMEDINRNVDVNVQYTSEAMTIGYLNRTGYTYYALRSNRDKDNLSPIKSLDYLTFHLFNDGTPAYRPTLIVTYTGPAKIQGIASITGISSITF